MSDEEPTNPEGVAGAGLFIDSEDLTPTMIAEALGLQPTSAYLKGTPIATPGEVQGPIPQALFRIPRRQHSFVLIRYRQYTRRTTLDSANALEGLLSELLGQIESVADRLDGIRHQVSLLLMCCSGSYGGFGDLSFSESSLQRLAALRIRLRLSIVPLRDQVCEIPNEHREGS